MQCFTVTGGHSILFRLGRQDLWSGAVIIHGGNIILLQMRLRQHITIHINKRDSQF